MSRIGRKPVDVPAGVTVTVEGQTVSGKNAKESMTLRVPDLVSVRLDGGKVLLEAREDTTAARQVHGVSRTLVANMVQGLKTPYVRDLEIQGVGFRATQQGTKVTLALGFSHPIEFEVPEGIVVKVTDGTSMSVSGADKHLVGDVAARLRGYFPAEPYKGKGVRYKGEHVRRKAGKAVA